MSFQLFSIAGAFPAILFDLYCLTLKPGPPACRFQPTLFKFSFLRSIPGANPPVKPIVPKFRVLMPFSGLLSISPSSMFRSAVGAGCSHALTLTNGYGIYALGRSRHGHGKN